ncbi:MAG: agmatine deiminase family protein [Ilumatobacteraceae bacterium]
MIGLRMPGEFAEHERTVMCWPCREAIYPGPLMAEACAAHAEVARTVARYEPVTMIAGSPAAVADAAQQCGSAVEVVQLPIDDSWFRDSGPIYVKGGGTRVALDWVFNGWGEKFAPFAADAAVARRWAQHAGHEMRSVPMVLEGGSISVDGAGTAVTTLQCLMHPNRNPSMNQLRIAEYLRGELGLEVVLWLPHGLALDDDTDGHVDNVAAFARPGTLVVQGCHDQAEADWLRMNVNARMARDALDARGEPIEVVEVPVLPFVEREGQRLAVPYLNYYVGNGFVVVPVCGNRADDEMLQIIASQYPGRETIGLDVGAILAIGGGGIHCITQQIPS